MTLSKILYGTKCVLYVFDTEHIFYLPNTEQIRILKEQLASLVATVFAFDCYSETVWVRQTKNLYNKRTCVCSKPFEDAYIRAANFSKGLERDFFSVRVIMPNRQGEENIL